MKRLEYHVERHPGSIGGFVDAAYVSLGQDVRDALVESVVQGISTDLYVTIGGTRMFLAAWQDPEHWAEQWRDAHNLSAGEVRDLLDKTMVESDA